MTWDVRLWSDVESWLFGLDDDTYDLIAAAIDHLAGRSPVLGRPLVDRIRGSSQHEGVAAGARRRP